MKKPVLVGIDVSARTLDVAIDTGREVVVDRFDNDTSGHKRLVKRLGRGGRNARVALEATGVYHLELALALHGARRIEVMVANPRRVKDFVRAEMHRSKTDRTDARALVEFVRRMDFVAWQPPAPEILALRALARHLEALAAMRAQERNRAHASEQVEAWTAPVREAIAEHVAFIDETTAKVEAQALEVIARNDRLQRAFDHMVSVKGIATKAAIAILAELAVLPDDMTPRQWVAHAGLDPRHEESGTSVRASVRISKVGNRHLRRALYMPALVAVQHEPAVRAFYEKLLARGKKPMQANVAVMRKLLHALHGMLAHDQDFDGEKFFSMSA